MIKIMKSSAFALLCVLLFAGAAAAQHCPFDGANLIVIHLINSQGKPITGARKYLSLREVDNQNANSCTYAKGLISKPFSTPIDIFKTYKYYKLSELTNEFCEGCTFLSKGYYAVNLGSAEESCMIKNGNDYDYQPRKFEVLYDRGTIAEKIEVPKDSLYSLCTANGRWSRIQPLDLKLKGS